MQQPTYKLFTGRPICSWEKNFFLQKGGRNTAALTKGYQFNVGPLYISLDPELGEVKEGLSF